MDMPIQAATHMITVWARMMAIKTRGCDLFINSMARDTAIDEIAVISSKI